MKSRTKVRFAKVLLVVSLIGWPLSALTFASSEPPVVLGLSWFAISLTALDVLFTSQVNEEVEEGTEEVTDQIGDCCPRCGK